MKLSFVFKGKWIDEQDIRYVGSRENREVSPMHLRWESPLNSVTLFSRWDLSHSSDITWNTIDIKASPIHPLRWHRTAFIATLRFLSTITRKDQGLCLDRPPEGISHAFREEGKKAQIGWAQNAVWQYLPHFELFRFEAGKCVLVSGKLVMIPIGQAHLPCSCVAVPAYCNSGRLQLAYNSTSVLIFM